MCRGVNGRENRVGKLGGEGGDGICAGGWRSGGGGVDCVKVFGFGGRRRGGEGSGGGFEFLFSTMIYIR